MLWTKIGRPIHIFIHKNIIYIVTKNIFIFFFWEVYSYNKLDN